jgi:LPXTG-site transpeptidase (sortase) family protein
MKAQRILRFSAVALILGGLIISAPLGYFWVMSKLSVASADVLRVPAVAPKPIPKPTLVTGSPKLLTIPSLGINLHIADGTYNQQTGEWALSWDKVHYALPTTIPNNESGNTLIYGHYKKGVLLTLHNVKAGEEAHITTDNGYRFVYKFQSAETVSPTDVSVFQYQGPSRLTIQTCSGRFMQNRQLYYFAFERYEKIPQQ